MSTTNFDEITTEVTSQVATQKDRATDAVSDARQFLNALTNAALYAPNFVDSVTPANILLTTPPLAGIPPTKPTTNINKIKASIPTQPGDFEATVTDRALQDSPQEQFSSPTINFPTAPTFTQEAKPSSPTIALPSKVPDTPSLTVPTDLTVSAKNVPDIPSVTLPDWGETIPSLSIELPSTTLAYVEPVYTSALKTAIAADLLTKVQNGGTGLNATVEGNIWNRQIERLNQQLDDDIDRTLNLFADRGFPMPTGIVAAQVQELQINFANDRSQASRDVAIEQARIANENTKAFLQTGLSLEEIEINHANNIANRALEAEKSVIEFSIALFNSKVAKFNAELQRYEAKAIEVDNRIKIQRLKLEQYDSELQGVQAEATKDNVRIDNYRAKLASHDAVIKLYEAETGATLAALNIEREKLRIFQHDIEAYVAFNQAKNNEYNLYRSEVEGEQAKINLYRTNVDAYNSRVNAVKTSNDVQLEKIRSDIEKERLNLQAHLANIDIWKEKSQLAIQELGIEKDFYTADIGKFQEETKKDTAQAELNLATQTRGIQIEQQNAEISLQTAIANVNMLIEQSKTRIAAAKGTSDGYVSLATVAAGVIQTMLQLGTTGTDNLNTAA